jgi:mannose-6-phosphate isomerase-like protein (cupin superfamily)
VSVEVTHLDELERLPVDHEGLTWRPVRRRLGIEGFGVNAWSADEAGQRVIEDHTEGTNQHEELYIVVSGRATFAVGDDELDVPAGTLVFVPPSTRRGAVAAEPGTTVLVLAGKRGTPFAVSAWETVYAAYAHRRLGDLERARALLDEAVAADPTAWQGQYHLACFSALDGDLEAALRHLQRAVELDPKAAEWAADDEDLASIRDDPRFPQPRS